MAILRIQKKRNNFVILDKTFLNDTRLSWKAKGLLSYLLGLPADWEVMVKDLINRASDGRDSIFSALKDLKKHGYVCHQIQRSDNGKFTKGNYDVFETPQTDFPYTENPDRGKPYPENPPQLNNKDNKYTKDQETAEANTAAVFNCLESQDLLIGERLTAAQKELLIKIITPLCQPEETSRIVSEIEYALLDKTSFSKAGQNFMKKLNTIAKRIRQGEWLTPVGMLEAKEKARRRLSDDFSQQISLLKSERNSCLTFLEFARQKGDQSTVNYYQQELDRLDGQLKTLKGEQPC